MLLVPWELWFAKMRLGFGIKKAEFLIFIPATCSIASNLTFLKSAIPATLAAEIQLLFAPTQCDFRPWIYTSQDSGSLIAYAVFLRQDRRLVGLKRVSLVDFQCLDQEKAPALFTAMLRAAFERCRQESVHMLELTGLNPLMEECAERASPHRRQLPSWMYFYKSNDGILREKLLDADVWEPSVFDGDSPV